MKIGKVEINTIDIVTFLGMMITLFTSILNLFQNKKSMYINNITKYRVASINKLKQYIAELKQLCDITNLFIISNNIKDKIEFRRQLDKNNSLIKLNLNFSKDLDRQLINHIEKIKVLINNYLLMNYCKHEFRYIKDDDKLVKKFIEIINTINEKSFLKEILNFCEEENEYMVENLNMLQLKSKIKKYYIENNILVSKVINKSDCILQKYENDLEIVNEELDKIVQIYLKSEWIKCKKETKMWPFNIYNEKKEIQKLLKKYHSFLI